MYFEFLLFLPSFSLLSWWMIWLNVTFGLSSEPLSETVHQTCSFLCMNMYKHYFLASDGKLMPKKYLFWVYIKNFRMGMAL